MIIELAAIAAATASGCTPVAGADQLWRPGIRWVLVGELHGTNEIPDAFANLVCLAGERQRAVTVALEYSADWQDTIDTYLASDGGAAARAALLAIPVWGSRLQDGRTSTAFLRLFERLRVLKRAGRIAGVVAADVRSRAAMAGPRDAAMARAWQAIPVAGDGVVLALVGNLHAMRTSWTFAGRTIETAGSLMPRAQTMTVNVMGLGGTAWTCQDDGCAPHAAGDARFAKAGIAATTDPAIPYDAMYELGVPTTAALPAKAVR